MSYGDYNEFMVFPVIDIVRRELKHYLTNVGRPEIPIRTTGSGEGDTFQTNVKEDRIVSYGDVLNRLNSNDYELTLNKDDEFNPNRLTSVVVHYGEVSSLKDGLKQVINLIRKDNKLSAVKIILSITEAKYDSLENPFEMSGGDFVEYVLNKRIWRHYSIILDDPTIDEETELHAEERIAYVESRNQDLRNMYGILKENDKTYEELVEYTLNPLGMEVRDFINYCLNLRIINSSEASVEEKEEAQLKNEELREIYYIPEEDAEAFPHHELEDFLPNPLGMHLQDFITFVNNLEEMETILEMEEPDMDLYNSLEAENNELLDNYYTSNSASSDYLKTFIDEDGLDEEERVLLKFFISLIYDRDGKLEKVRSSTI